MDHMVSEGSAFIWYKVVRNLRVRMGNNSYAPVLGRGTATILLNGQGLLIWNVLHVPALCVPLYSLRAHLYQRGCGFVGSYNTGMHVYFPGVVLSMDTSINCHLSYRPIGKSAPLSTLHYVQPRCPPTNYPDKGSAFQATMDSPAPVLVEDDGGLVMEPVSPTPGVSAPTLESSSLTSVVLKCGPLPKLLSDRMSGIIRKSWSTWLMLTSQRSKCLGHSGSMPWHTPPK